MKSELNYKEKYAQLKMLRGQYFDIVDGNLVANNKKEIEDIDKELLALENEHPDLTFSKNL